MLGLIQHPGSIPICSSIQEPLACIITGSKSDPVLAPVAPCNSRMSYSNRGTHPQRCLDSIAFDQQSRTFRAQWLPAFQCLYHDKPAKSHLNTEHLHCAHSHAHYLTASSPKVNLWLIFSSFFLPSHVTVSTGKSTRASHVSPRVAASLTLISMRQISWKFSHLVWPPFCCRPFPAITVLLGSHAMLKRKAHGCIYGQPQCFHVPACPQKCN